MSRWFRVYDDLLDDPKVQRLQPALFKTWINLLCLASKHDGVLPSLDDIAFALRMTGPAVKAAIDSLIDAGLIDQVTDGLTPHNWDERQFKSDRDPTASRRQKAKRDRDKPRDVTRDGAVTSHPPETETETETETVDAELSSANARDASAELEAKLREAAGWQNEISPKLAITGPIEALIEAGAIPETDIFPVIRSIAHRADSRSTWKFFIPAIIRARDDRLAALTAVSPAQQGNHADEKPSRHSRARNREVVDAIIAEAERRENAGSG